MRYRIIEYIYNNGKKKFIPEAQQVGGEEWITLTESCTFGVYNLSRDQYNDAVQDIKAYHNGLIAYTKHHIIEL